MSVLLLRFSGPLQSWGTQSRFNHRDSGMEPSKSGVVGLLACALGRSREANLNDLAALRLGVRVDRPGYLETDYQTASNVRTIPKGKGSKPEITPTVQSWRQYLSDASFLVGLEGERAFLAQLESALKAPVWPLFLGRKSFVPSEPITLPCQAPLGPGIREGELAGVLANYPWIYGDDKIPERLGLILEFPIVEAETVRADQPVGAAFTTRRFVNRGVRTLFVATAGLEKAGGG